MSKQNVLERYLDVLLKGDRIACRAVIEEALQSGIPANSVYMDVIWPIMLEIDNLYQQERINSVQRALATRINRTIIDQLQNKLPRKPRKFKKIVVCSAAIDQAELGAQMTADLFESDGWEVRFLGGGVNNDDILSFTHSYNPDILLIYGVCPKSAPDVRKLIIVIREINAWPDMRIMLSGGVFDRAEGLWEEIGADLYASTASNAVALASAKDVPVPTRTINRRKKQAVNSTVLAEAGVVN